MCIRFYHALGVLILISAGTSLWFQILNFLDNKTFMKWKNFRCISCADARINILIWGGSRATPTSNNFLPWNFINFPNEMNRQLS